MRLIATFILSFVFGAAVCQRTVVPIPDPQSSVVLVGHPSTDAPQVYATTIGVDAPLTDWQIAPGVLYGFSAAPITGEITYDGIGLRSDSTTCVINFNAVANHSLNNAAIAIRLQVDRGSGWVTFPIGEIYFDRVTSGVSQSGGTGLATFIKVGDKLRLVLQADTGTTNMVSYSLSAKCDE